MLALNINDRSYQELLLPLANNQAAPIGFLWLQKAVMQLFNYTDWSARIISFVSFIGSVFLFKRIAGQHFNSSKLGALAAAFFALLVQNIKYACDGKQYMLEVFVTLLLISDLVYNNKSRTKSKIVRLSLLCMGAVWFSHIGIFILFACFTFGLGKHFQKKDLLVRSLPLLLGFISFLTYYFLFIHNHPTQLFMKQYWLSHSGFFEPNIFSFQFLKDVSSKIYILFELAGFGSFTFLFIIPTIPGIWLMFKNSRTRAFVWFSLIIIHFILSYFQLYPIASRFILYLIPSLILFFITTLHKLLDNKSIKAIRLSPYLYFLPLLALCYPLARNIPLKNEDVKGAELYLMNSLKTSDQLYLYSASDPAFTFYQTRHNFKPVKNTIEFPIESNRLVVPKTPNSLTYVLIAPFSWQQNEKSDEQKAIIPFFNKNGFQVQEVINFHDTKLYKMKHQ